MHRKMSITLTAIAFLLVTFGVVVSTFSHTDPSNAQVASGTPVTSGGVASPHNWGIPAIPVKQGVNAALTTTGAAFTANDVTQYLNTHPVPQAVNPQLPPTIAQILFLKSRDVVTLLHGEPTGFPDDTMLCYVELQGQFNYSGPGQTYIFPKSIEVFDATTGNLVLVRGQV